MIGLAVSGIEKVQGNLKRAAAEAKAATEAAMKRATIIVGRNLREELTAPESRDAFWGKVGARGLGLSRRSGKTAASITAGTRVYRVGESVVGVVGSAERHLKLHEDGGTVSGSSPKGYHRIPTAMAQTAAGVDRNAGRSIKGMPGVFLIRTSKGKLWAVRQAGGKRSSRMEFLYLFVKSVKYKARHIFARMATKSQPEVSRVTKDQVAAVVRKANT